MAGLGIPVADGAGSRKRRNQHWEGEADGPWQRPPPTQLQALLSNTESPVVARPVHVPSTMFYKSPPKALSEGIIPADGPAYDSSPPGSPPRTLRRPLLLPLTEICSQLLFRGSGDQQWKLDFAFWYVV
jgi:hypothetical protein